MKRKPFVDYMGILCILLGLTQFEPLCRAFSDYLSCSVRTESYLWTSPYSEDSDQPAHITKHAYLIFIPLNPTFLEFLMGFTGVYISFLKIIDCGYSLEPPRRGGSNEYPQSLFRAEIWKMSYTFIWQLYLVIKFSVYLNRHVFVMIRGLIRDFTWCILDKKAHTSEETVSHVDAQ